MPDPGQGCGCARCREPLPAIAEHAGGPEGEAYTARRADWRARADHWLRTRPLPGSPRTVLHATPLTPPEGP